MIDNKTIRKVIMLNKLLPSGEPTYENREASGAVANFETNTVQPFVKCECTIDATESGTDELKLTKTGKNLFDPETAFASVGSYLYAKSIFPKGVNLICSFTEKDPSVNITGLYFGFYDDTYVSGGAQGGHYRWLIDNGNIQSNLTNITNQSIKCDGLFAYPQNQNTITKLLQRFNIQIELGSTPTTYEPYIGSTYTVTLEEAAYGGSVDVIAGTGQIIDEYGNLVYTLFEPVSISALEGVNNVWTDVGNTKVTYKYKTGEGGSSTKKYLPIFYDLYGEEKYK